MSKLSAEASSLKSLSILTLPSTFCRQRFKIRNGCKKLEAIDTSISVKKFTYARESWGTLIKNNGILVICQRKGLALTVTLIYSLKKSIRTSSSNLIRSMVSSLM